MKSKLTCKHLAALICMGSLFTTLIVLVLFQENMVKNISSFKLRYYQNGQVLQVKPTNISADTFTSKPLAFSISTPQSFAKLMHSFPWISFENVTIQNNTPEIKRYAELLLNSILIPFIIKEPPIPINTSCKAPILPSKPNKCPSAFKKIGVILNFGFDVDALEVHLHELNYLVDKFFLVEGLKINNRILGAKPSVWDLVKDTPRFSQFRPKIVHFVVDDADYHEGNTAPGLWDRETLQGKLRLQKFLEWNKATGHFSPDDWIGIGDTDEIPSRQAINLLKNCEMKADYDGGIDIGIWFPFPYDDTIYKTDFPVHSHPFTLGNPTYWKVSAMEAIHTRYPGTGRRAGKGNKFLLGGMHFSNFPYLPFQLIKSITGSESEVNGIKWAIKIGMTYLNDTKWKHDTMEDNFIVETAALKKWEWRKLNKKQFEGKGRIESLMKFRRRFGDQETKKIVKIPWFYRCNPERYPGFKRKLDKRLFS